MTKGWGTTLAVAAIVVVVTMPAFKAADTIPARYTDAEFWRLLNDFSEPGGAYQYENFVIEPGWSGFLANLKALPQDSGTLVIRQITPKIQLLGWMKDVPERWPAMYTNPNLGLTLR